jgi:hypothetical protein
VSTILPNSQPKKCVGDEEFKAPPVSQEDEEAACRQACSSYICTTPGEEGTGNTKTQTNDLDFKLVIGDTDAAIATSEEEAASGENRCYDGWNNASGISDEDKEYCKCLMLNKIKQSPDVSFIDTYYKSIGRRSDQKYKEGDADGGSLMIVWVEDGSPPHGWHIIPMKGDTQYPLNEIGNCSSNPVDTAMGCKQLNAMDKDNNTSSPETYTDECSEVCCTAWFPVVNKRATPVQEYASYRVGFNAVANSDAKGSSVGINDFKNVKEANWSAPPSSDGVTTGKASDRSYVYDSTSTLKNSSS